MSKIISTHGWEGNCKKVEFKDEDVIRNTFEYASLIGTDFTEAMRRVLKIALPLMIQSERESQARLAACFSQFNSSYSPSTQQQPQQSYTPEPSLVIPPPKIYSTPAIEESPRPSRTVKSGGHLI